MDEATDSDNVEEDENTVRIVGHGFAFGNKSIDDLSRSVHKEVERSVSHVHLLCRLDGILTIVF